MKNLYKALAAFQNECPVIHKGSKGYGYSYSSLPEIFDVIMPLLKKHGLGFTQGMNDDCLDTTVFHVDSGESLTKSAKIPYDIELKGMNRYQVIGSGITYFRRYQLGCMFGLITDIDTDASGEQVKPKLQGEALTKAKKYLSEGGNIETIRKKYYIEDEKVLQDV